MQRSMFLSGQERLRMGEDHWWNFTNPKNAPTGEELFLNDAARNELSLEYDMKPIHTPPIGATSCLDLEPFRASIAAGRVGGLNAAYLAERAPDMTDDELAYHWVVQNGTPEQIQAINAQATQGQ